MQRTDSDNNAVVQVDADRTFGAMIAGGIGAALGWLGGEFYARNKLRPFEGHVANLTRDDIMKRGAGPGLGAMGGSAMDGMGAAFGSGIIEQKHTLDLLNSGEHKFAKFIYNLGGKSSFGLAMALGVGAASFGLYKMLAPRKDTYYYPDRVARKSYIADGEDALDMPVQAKKRINKMAKLDPAQDETDLARRLHEHRNDPVKRQEILNSWQKRIAAAEEHAADHDHTPSHGV